MKNLTSEQYLGQVLKILHAGSGTGAGQSDAPAAAKLRDDFVVVLHTAAGDDDADNDGPHLSINLRRGSVCFADIVLRELQVWSGWRGSFCLGRQSIVGIRVSAFAAA
jgi:hypothetical protein